VCIGKLKRRAMNEFQVRDVNRYLKNLHPHLDINVPNICKSVKAIVKESDCGDIVRFKVGDTCILAGGPNLEEEWFMSISSFVQVGPIDSVYHLFVDGDYYIPAFDAHRRNAIVHPWTKTNQLVPREYNQGKMQPTMNLKRRCILYPEPSNLDNPVFYLPIDFEKPESSIQIITPVYPKEDDDIKIQAPGNDVWYGRVVDVDASQKTANVTWYLPTSRRDIWTLGKRYDSIKFSTILSLVTFERAPGGPRKFKLIAN
jgi:hypothetical protein